MYTQSNNPRKVIIPREEVAAFVAQRVGCGLRDTRAYWFEFDQEGNEIDSDVPAHDEAGGGAAELSALAWEWLQNQSTAEPTSGEWRYAPDLSAVVVIRNHRVVAVADFGKSDLPETEANARLIASAKKSLAAMIKALEVVQQHDPKTGFQVSPEAALILRAAIAEAKGKQ